MQNNRIYRSTIEPIRQNLSYAERWHGIERALVTCWEVGRQKRARDLKELQMRLQDSERTLTERAEAGELPVMGWTGGVSALLKGQKYGSLHYLAQWQGLRGKDLDIDLSQETAIICAKTSVKVIFTANPKRWGR